MPEKATKEKPEPKPAQQPTPPVPAPPKKEIKSGEIGKPAEPR